MASTEQFTSYPTYRESGVEWLGQIPTHWTCLSLARVTRSRCDGPFGSGLKSQHYSVDGVRVIRLQNIGGPEFLNSDQVFVDESHADALGNHSVLHEDLLVAGLGDDAHPVGRACVAPEGLGRAMVKQTASGSGLTWKGLFPNSLHISCQPTRSLRPATLRPVQRGQERIFRQRQQGRSLSRQS